MPTTMSHFLKTTCVKFNSLTHTIVYECPVYQEAASHFSAFKLTTSADEKYKYLVKAFFIRNAVHCWH